MYEITFDEQWLLFAKNIADYVIQHFFNANTGLFFYTSINDAPLIARKTETSDNVIPASNSSMAKVLFQLGIIFDKNDYIEKAKRALANMHENVIAHPSFYANWAILADWFIEEPFQIAIAGENAHELRKQFSKHFLPNCLFVGSSVSLTSVPLLERKYAKGETLIYVCQNKTCQLPVYSIEEALKQISNSIE